MKYSFIDLLPEGAEELKNDIKKMRRKLGKGCIILSHGAGSYSIQASNGDVYKLR